VPEEPEVETEKLHEAIHEELEREGGALLKRIAFTTAVLAALAAVASLGAGGTVNEALVLRSDATRFQAQASDQWAYYQAKGIKKAVTEASATTWRAAGRTPHTGLEQQAAKYSAEQDSIQKDARELETKRDDATREADHLLHRHHRFADAVALFQVAIALGAVAALTRQRAVWFASMLVGIGGLVMFALAQAH
jgi:hypothetical protein